MILQFAAAAAAKSLQSCPTLCNPVDGSPLGSAVPGILQARTLERVAISFSSAGKWKVKVKSLSRVRLLVTSWTAAYRAPPSMGFSRQEYWSGVPLPSPLQYKVKYFLKNRKKKKVRSLITWQRIKKLIIVKYLLCTIQGSGLQWAYCLVEKINIKHFFLFHLLIVTVEQ